MFKGNKEKSNNPISAEEVEKMYEFQKKIFNAQIAEQNEKIEELVDYVSARFGENIQKSTITKNLEDHFKNIENNYKANLEDATKSIKKEI